ncbi:MAG: hypothetical protein Q4C56_02565 [Peptococcaceae bacterium]|nr:hypothetical protein [Peptococcaceae bacterium]
MTVKNAMNLFRDVQVAEEFRQMADEGYLDTEFTMYGTVYVENGTRRYIISSKEDKIIDATENDDIFAMPVSSCLEICPVPMGEKERIAYEVKIQLAKQLQRAYPEEFFEIFNNFSHQDGNDEAADLIWQWVKKVDATFSSEILAVVEAMARFAFRRKALSRATYEEFSKWFQEEWKNFEEDIIPKDVLHKTWYTLTYIEPSGRIKQATNARKEWVYHKQVQLIREGKIVAPVYSKTYWYNNQITPDSIKKQHVHHCREIIDSDYISAIMEIAGCTSIFSRKDLEQTITECAEAYGEKAADALRYYGYVWGVK